MTYHEEGVELPPELRPPIVVERPLGSGIFVRLSDSYLRSIVYLGFPHPETESGIDPIGTGFLLDRQDETYLITAAHVAKQLSEVPFGIRLNRADNGIGQLDHIESAVWYPHPDDKVDVAVLPYAPPRWARVKYVHAGTVISEFKRRSKDIGVGDLAYVVGIFKAVRAKDKNVPVVHTGHIASMADNEPLVTMDWRHNYGKPSLVDIDGYLVQTHTMPQASGSPVFVRRSLQYYGTYSLEKNPTDEQRAERLISGTYGSVWLLGLWHGAWVNDLSTALNVVKGSVVIGSGMGVCIPAPKIIEAIDQPKLQALRQEMKAKKEAEYAVTPQTDRAIVKRRDAILFAAMNTPPVEKSKAKKAKRAHGGVSNK